MKHIDLPIAVLSLVIIALGLFYKKTKTSLINETILATVIGILISPLVLDILDMANWGSVADIMETTCRLTLAMALMATAFRIPDGYLRSNTRTQLVLLLLVMPGMLLCSSSIIHYVGGLSWQLSLLIGAIISPTDPVLAGTIVTGENAEKNLPARMRDTISFESGANDGLAFPFVMLALLFIENQSNAWENWISDTLLFQTGGGIAIGLLLGLFFGKMLEYCVKKDYTGKPAILAFALSLALFILSALELIHVNSILAVFAAGLMLKRSLSRQEDIEEEEIQEMMARLFTLPVFVFFGLILPWQQWIGLGWRAPALIILVLLLRRLPVLILCKPLMRGYDMKSVAFMGWFGPIGAAALFYCFYCYKRLHASEVWTLTSLIVFSSIFLHGITSSPLLKRYGKK